MKARLPRRCGALLGAFFSALPEPAAAYIGPGAGAGAVAVAVAVVIGVLLLTVGLVWYPLKRLLRRRGRSRTRDAGTTTKRK